MALKQIILILRSLYGLDYMKLLDQYQYQVHRLYINLNEIYTFYLLKRIIVNFDSFRNFHTIKLILISDINTPSDTRALRIKKKFHHDYMNVLM